MKSIKGVLIDNLVVVIKGTTERGNVDLGALTLSVDGREFILDIVQSYSNETDDGLHIVCDLEVDEETFAECPYDITKEDLLNYENNGLVRTLYVGGEEDFDVVSIVLDFEVDGQHYQIGVDEE